jgi:hypothetical protein
MNTNHDPLKDALAAWRDIDPRPGFEDSVWRRIEAQPNVTRASSPWLPATEITGWKPVSLFATAAGVIAGIVIGLALAAPPSPRAHEFALLNSGSLAGSYVHLVSGDSP